MGRAEGAGEAFGPCAWNRIFKRSNSTCYAAIIRMSATGGTRQASGGKGYGWDEVQGIHPGRIKKNEGNNGRDPDEIWEHPAQFLPRRCPQSRE